MTFIEKFDYLKNKYASKADLSKFTDSFIAAQITMSDDDCGGTFYCAFINGVLNFEPYDYHDNTVAVIVNSKLLEDCIAGKADPVKEYLDGRLQAWGNLDHALQLIECLKGKKRCTRKKAEAALEETAAEEAKAPKKRACGRKKAATVTAEITEKEPEITEEIPKKKTARKTASKKTEKE